MNKLETLPNLGITEHDGVDLTLQKHLINAVYPATGSQYFLFSDSKKSKNGGNSRKKNNQFYSKTGRKDFT
jgi:hypothetical protein